MSRSGLMLRYADRVDPVAVPGGRRGTAPFFSPDGQWLGFQDGARLVKVPLAGGATVAICDSCVGYAHSWGGDDTVRYHSAAEKSANIRVLMAVPGRGGVPREFARPDSGSGESFRQPILLPGRRTVLFALYTGSTSRLASLDLKTGAVTRFDQAGFTSAVGRSRVRGPGQRGRLAHRPARSMLPGRGRLAPRSPSRATY